MLIYFPAVVRPDLPPPSGMFSLFHVLSRIESVLQFTVKLLHDQLAAFGKGNHEGKGW